MKKKILSFCVLFILIVSSCSHSKVNNDALYDSLQWVRNVKNLFDFDGVASMPSIELGSYDGEPIEWVVLKRENETALLMSKYVIDSYIFDKRRGCFWQNCELRRWLNDDFFEKSFSSNEKSFILNSCVDNANLKIDIAPGKYIRGNGENTIDKIFVLSSDEWGEFDKTPLQYFEFKQKAKDNYEPLYNDGNYGLWLRGKNSIFYYTDKPGGAGLAWGLEGIGETNQKYGIRPCMWVKMYDINVKDNIYNDGVKVVSQLINDGYDKYYVDENGNLCKNMWNMERYFDSDGKMLRNTKVPDGSFVNYEGKKVVISDEINGIDENSIHSDTWVKTKNELWFYFENDKSMMKKGWLVDPQDKQTYYLDEDTGIMATGWRKINGANYYFSEEHSKTPNWYYDSDTDVWLSHGIEIKSYGSMYRDEMTPDGHQVDADGKMIR